MDTREWRVGSHYGIHLYAVNVDGVDDDEPLGTALSPQIAEQVVAEHTQANRQWEMDATNARVIHRLKDERNNADATATRWSEKVEKLADENDELARKLNAAVELHDHQVIENHRLRGDLTKLDEKLRRSVREHHVTRDDLAKNVRSREADRDRIADLYAENTRLRVELNKALVGEQLRYWPGVGEQLRYWPGVGDRVRHLRHGGTGTVTAPAAAREPTVEVRGEFGQSCHWFVKSLEPLYAKDGRVADADECAD